MEIFPTACAIVTSSAFACDSGMNSLRWSPGMNSLRRQHALAAAIPFFMHTDRALDHDWLRNCDGFEALRHSAYNERLAEVYVRDALAHHPWRTYNPSDALLVYIPVWEVVSFNVGECNGTTHSERMQAAATALRASPFFKSTGVKRGSSGSTSGGGGSSSRSARPGFTHLLVSSGCIEKGKRLFDRLGRPFANLLRTAIVGRDRAYSPFYQTSAVGRCVLEIPYVSNPYAHVAYARAVRRNASLALSALPSNSSKLFSGKSARAVSKSTKPAKKVKASKSAGKASGKAAGKAAAKAVAKVAAKAAGKVAKAKGSTSTASARALEGVLPGSSSGSSSGGGGGGSSSSSSSSSSSGRRLAMSAGDASAGTAAMPSVHGGRRRYLLSFMGSLDVCCEPGKSIRAAMRKLVDLPTNQSTRILHFARAEGRPLPGRTPKEQNERYRAAGELMLDSRFCLVPAGDNEVSSRLYSAMSAGCLPVVVANQLSGAFASQVPYDRFWLRVEQQTFINQPLGLLQRLRAVTSAELAERRSLMHRYVADVTYDQPLPHSPPPSADTANLSNSRAVRTRRGGFGGGGGASGAGGAGGGGERSEEMNQFRGGALAALELAAVSGSAGKSTMTPAVASSRTGGVNGQSSRPWAQSRLVANLLRAAHAGCVLGAATPMTGVYPRNHKYAGDDKWGLNCSCTQAPPRFFWGGASTLYGKGARAKLWSRGKVPTEVCRCLHCATLCPVPGDGSPGWLK